MIAATVKAFVTGTYTVTRTAAGSYSGGLYTPGAESSFTIDAGIFPLTGRELANLPQGQHGTEVRQLFTLTELKTRTPSTEPDTIDISGETWEVLSVSQYPSFYRALIARTDTP